MGRENLCWNGKSKHCHLTYLRAYTGSRWLEKIVEEAADLLPAPGQGGSWRHCHKMAYNSLLQRPVKNSEKCKRNLERYGDDEAHLHLMKSFAFVRLPYLTRTCCDLGLNLRCPPSIAPPCLQPEYKIKKCEKKYCVETTDRVQENQSLI